MFNDRQSRPASPIVANGDGGGYDAPPSEGEQARCPECNDVLENAHHAEKHSIIHYGLEPLAVNHGTLLARQRQAALLGETVPER